MSDNFDYRKDSIHFVDLLPDYFRNDINVSTFTNGIDRLLTPEDSVFVQGKVGKQKPSEVHIQEDDLFRTTWQLQPLIYSSLGTQEYITSWYDILNKLSVHGVDIERQDKWLDCDQFNFAPPIDLDKFINFRDYYWTENSTPDYITMDNSVTRANSLIFEINNGTETTTKASSLALAEQQKTTAQNKINEALNVIRDHTKVIKPKYQWINSNKWVHKSELSGQSYAERAKLPIIEYFNNIEVNTWTYTKHNWKYKSGTTSTWVSVDTGPLESELLDRFPIVDTTKETFVVYGDARLLFKPGFVFCITDSVVNDGLHTVATGATAVVYDSATKLTTIKTVTLHNISNTKVYVDVFNSTEYYGATGEFYGVVIPFTTTKFGDAYTGLFNHWLLDSVEPVVPINQQNSNLKQKLFSYIVPDTGYDVSMYDGFKDKNFGYDGQSRFTFPIDYIFDTDDIQVYLNGVRQYGTYSESFNIDNNGRYDAEPYNSSRFDSPRHPNAIISNSIDFNMSLTSGDHIVIKVGPASADDYTRYAAVVQYKDIFGNIQIGTKNLIQYRLHEQVKTSTNQHILFDIYNVDGTTRYTANEIFKYHEDVTSRVNTDLNQRINTTANNYQFNNLLTSGSELLCYKEYLPNEVLNTVWRKSSTKYIPKKLDMYRESTSNLEKDWELPEPLKCNIQHECRQDLTYSELFSHFTKILSNQQPLKNYIPSDRIGKLNSKLDYIGGNIKEHNGNLDYLISSNHQDVINFKSVIDFAKNKYSDNLYLIKNTCLKRSAYYANTYKSLSNSQIYTTIANSIVTEVTNNLQTDLVYHDSTAFVNGVGVKNWIVTLPILGLYPAYEPRILTDSKLGINKLRHHDGHMSSASIDTIEYDVFIKTLTFDKTINNGNFKIDEVTGDVKRCYVNFYQTVDPSLNPANIIASGDLWYSPDTNTLKIYANSSWINTPISSAWTSFDINNIINESVFSIETELYKRAKQASTKINFNNIIGTETGLYIDYMIDRYATYLKTSGELNAPVIFSESNQFTWNYWGIDTPVFPVGSANAGQPQITIKYQQSQNWGSFWWQIYEYQYGTPYPHLEPWKLQGYIEKPNNWDNVYAAIPGTGAKWRTLMWVNIRNGVINSSLPPPPKVPPTYTVISVNDTGTTQGTYAPDDLLPPRISHPMLVANNSLVVFNSSSVVRPNSVQYAALFGNHSPQERQWRESIDYSYDMYHALFRLQPVKTLHATLSNEFYNVNGLLVDPITKNVPSYNTTVFHGMAYNGYTYLINNFNQWYSHALRTSFNKAGIDDFVSTWTSWVPKLTYQTNTVVKEQTVAVDNNIFALSDNDYSVKLKKTSGAHNIWLHSLRISLNEYGSFEKSITGVNLPTADDWKFRIDTLIPDGNTLPYYGVRQYKINHVSVSSNTFTIDPSLTIPWNVENNIRIQYTGLNFNPSYIYKIEQLPSNTFRLMTYDPLISQFVPTNLYDTINCYSYTSLIPDNGYTFDAITGNIIEYITDYSMTAGVNTSTSIVQLRDYDLKYDLTTNKLSQYRITTGKWTVLPQANNTFTLPVMHDNVYLFDKHVPLIKNVDYTVDTTYKTITLLKNITSLIVNIAIPDNTIIEERQESFKVSRTRSQADTWYHLSIDKANPVKNITVPLVVTGIQNVINIVDGYASYLEDHGFSFNDYSRPFVDPTTGTNLSWQTEIEKFITKVYTGFVTRFDQPLNSTTNQVAIYDYVDINPFKYEFWINTPEGIVSNIIGSPFKDIAVSPIVYDNNGKAITSIENLKIYRSDKESHVTHLTGSSHIGGMHLFLDYYENVVTFNDYTTNHNLIYDSFLGLNNEQLIFAFEKHFETTKRPHISGGYLSGSKIVDNIETVTNTFSKFYDLRADESKKHIVESRNILGYNTESYENDMNSRSKFLFWNGMIHHKGSNNSVERFVNTQSGESVVLDEMWMYKLGTYGNIENIREMYLNIFASDILQNKLKYQISSTLDNNDFILIQPNDVARWKNLPDIDNTNLFEYYVFKTLRYIVNPYVKHSSQSSTMVVSTLDPNNYVLLPNLFDEVELFVELNYDTMHTVSYNGSTLIDNIPEYLPGTGMISVHINGVKVANTAFTEVTTTSINLPILSSIKHNAKVVIIYGRGKLVPYDSTNTSQPYHYTVLSNDLIKLAIDWTKIDILDINLNRFNTNVITSNIVDTVNDIIVSSNAIFNPAYEVYHKSVNSVNFIRSDDPANYQDTFWSDEHVSEKWIDTYDLEYMPYYNSRVYTNIYDQIEAWGTTTPWSHITCYEWVASSVAPADWINNIGKINIAADREIVGKPLTILQKRTRATIYDTFGDWYDEVNTYQHVNAFEYTLVDNSITFTTTLVIDNANDSYGIYVNGIKNRTYTFTVKYDVDAAMIDTITVPNITDADKIVVIRFADEPDLTLEPSDTDLALYQEVFKYNVVHKYDASGSSVNSTFYFWVTNQVARNEWSTIDIERAFVDNTNTFSILLPNGKFIVKNVGDVVTSDDYAIQIITDPTIKADKKFNDINEHSVFTEWSTIRKNSLSKVPYELWSKVTESINGQNTDGSSIPSYARVLFDKANNTFTSYGIGKQQTLGPKELILTTLNDILNSDEFDISPIDKDNFLDLYTFDTVENTTKTMSYMYDRFSASNINEIFFEILNILYVHNNKIEGIMKSSMVTLDCKLTFKTG